MQDGCIIMETEQIVYPTQNEDYINDVEYQENSSIELTTTAEGSDVQIYDTIYNCIPMNNPDTFCTRASMIFDTVDCKDVLVDPSNDEINTLFTNLRDSN